nr:hypothetical protein [Endozoicomonas sp.]
MAATATLGYYGDKSTEGSSDPHIVAVPRDGFLSKNREREQNNPPEIESVTFRHITSYNIENYTNEKKLSVPDRVSQAKLKIITEPESPVIQQNALSEKDVIKKFKTMGSASYEAYNDLSERRVGSDDFEFHEVTACLEKLKEYLNKYSTKEGASVIGKTAFSQAVNDIYQLIDNKTPYRKTLDIISKVISIIDFYLYTREIKPYLEKTGMTANIEPDRIVLVSIVLSDDGLSYQEFRVCGETITGLEKLPLHSQINPAGTIRGFVFTYYSDNLTMENIYNCSDRGIKMAYDEMNYYYTSVCSN